MVKVGDKVRAVKGTCILNVGEVYEVDHADSELVWVYRGERYGLGDYPHDYFEPVAVADSNCNVEHGNRFKVGDRVKPKPEFRNEVMHHWRDYWTSWADKDPDDFIVIETPDWGEPTIVINTVTGHGGPYWPAGHFEPAPLTIQSGKFYRTRDGSKVGPAEVSDDYEYPWRASGALYMNNGRWLNDDIEDDNDIIAEWADEPVAAVASNNADIFDKLEDWMADNPLPTPAVTPSPTTGFTVPLDATEFGGAESKFKVGDRVAYLNTKFGEAIVTEVVDANHVEVDTRGHFGICTENVKDLRLVAEATTAQEPPTTIADIVRRLERLESAMWQRAA